eukprot:COSAG05_NODE_3005_length_2420_cov_2.665661_2_plen_296_part_00
MSQAEGAALLEPEAQAPEPDPFRPFDLVDNEIVVEKIFCHLAPKTLVRAGLVCKEWHGSSNADELWAELHDNVLVKRLRMHRQREGQLFFRAHFNAEAAAMLSVKEIKQLLVCRGLEARAKACFEKSELRDLVMRSSYPPLSAWHYELPSKWKASFAYAWKDRSRTLMTIEDLERIDWEFKFHEQVEAGRMTGRVIHSRFYRDFTYWSDFSGGYEAQDGCLLWRFVANGMVQVHEFPPFATHRTNDGGWRLTNHIGTFTCVDRLDGDACRHGPTGATAMSSRPGYRPPPPASDDS